MAPVMSIVVVILCTLVACSGPYSQPKVAAKEGDAALAVKVEPVVASNIPEIITATGELLAEDQATVSAKVPGRVKKIYVDLGSAVSEGQVLAELEEDDYQMRVQQAEALMAQTRARLGILDRDGDDVKPEETATVRQAEAALKEARFIFQTTERLQKEGVVSRIDFEKAQVRAQGVEAAYQRAVEEVMQLRAQLAERRAQVALAKQLLADCTIKAPFAGAVTRRHASTGEYLAVNGAVVTLVRQHPLRIRLEIPERLAVRVRVGQLIDVRIEGTDRTRTGRVVRLSPAIEAQNRSLVIEGEIPNADGVLRPGSFVEGVITVNPNAMGVAVPYNALLSFAGTERVFVVNNGVLEERMVRTGRRLGGERVEILSGLEAGERVVLGASDRLTKGQRVTVN